jgi:hypothetical protein
MVGERVLLTAALLMAGVACSRPILRTDPSADSEFIDHPWEDDPISHIMGYSARMKLGDKTHMADIILAYRFEPLADQYLCILRAAWKEGGTVVEIQLAPDFGQESFYHAILGKTVLPYDKKMESVMVSTRWVKEGEMGFVDRGFVESLPLVRKRVGKNEILTHHWDPLYFRIVSYGESPGDVVGSYWEYKLDESMEANPGYAKLGRDFKSALAWVFPDWLAEDGYKINKEWLAHMREFNPKVELGQ